MDGAVSAVSGSEYEADSERTVETKVVGGGTVATGDALTERGLIAAPEPPTETVRAVEPETVRRRPVGATEPVDGAAGRVGEPATGVVAGTARGSAAGPGTGRGADQASTTGADAAADQVVVPKAARAAGPGAGQDVDQDGDADAATDPGVEPVAGVGVARRRYAPQESLFAESDASFELLSGHDYRLSQDYSQPMQVALGYDGSGSGDSGGAEDGPTTPGRGTGAHPVAVGRAEPPPLGVAWILVLAVLLGAAAGAVAGLLTLR